MAKHRFLGDAKYNRGLRLSQNILVYNYYELLSELKSMADSEFRKILGKSRMNILEWITIEIGDFMLASRLRKAYSRKEYIYIIKSRIRELEEVSREIGSLLEKKKVLRERKNKLFPYVWFAVYVVLIAALVLQHMHYQDIASSLSDDASFFYEELMSVNKELFSLQSGLLVEQDRAERLEYEVYMLRHKNDALLEQVSRMALNPLLTPQSRIPEGSIILERNRIVMLVENPSLARFADTGSMLPLISHESKAIQVPPGNYSDILPGDIISFEDDAGSIIIHRVVETGFDENGWYAVTRGDNALAEDMERVRFGQVRRILVAVIY